jgi:hypothetical protein
MIGSGVGEKARRLLSLGLQSAKNDHESSQQNPATGRVGVRKEDQATLLEWTHRLDPVAYHGHERWRVRKWHDDAAMVII